MMDTPPIQMIIKGQDENIVLKIIFWHSFNRVCALLSLDVEFGIQMKQKYKQSNNWENDIYLRERKMASAMIHYTITNLILEKIEVADKERFLLGATLGPDASSHEDGTYDAAHFESISVDGMKKGFDWKKFAEKYENQILEDSFLLGYFCHLIQDAIWFHDVFDKYIRCLELFDERQKAYQRGCRDYERLNYLLIQEYQLGKTIFEDTVFQVDEISFERLMLGKENFSKWFMADSCNKEDLDLYSWGVITEYIEKSVSVCISELEALKRGRIGIMPESLFVKKHSPKI